MAKIKHIVYLLLAASLLCVPASAFAQTRNREADFSQYSQEYSTAQDGALVVTNSHDPELIDVTGGITWEDASNQDNIRPENVTIQLFNGDDEVVGKTQVISSENADTGNTNQWSYEFGDVPKYQNGGQLIDYTIQVTTTAPDGYTYTFTPATDKFYTIGLHEIRTTTRPFVVEFDDEDDRDGYRPETVTVQLYQNGQPFGEPITVGPNDDWDDIFSNLPENVEGEVGTPAVYTVNVPADVPQYTSQFDPETGVLKLTHITELTNITVRKIWDDANDQDGIRSDSVCIVLKGDTEDYSIQLNTTNAADDNTWEYVFQNVHQKKDHGTVITYSIEETGETCSAAPAPAPVDPASLTDQTSCEAESYVWHAASCSAGDYDNQYDCEAAMGTWTDAYCAAN